MGLSKNEYSEGVKKHGLTENFWEIFNFLIKSFENL